MTQPQLVRMEEWAAAQAAVPSVPIVGEDREDTGPAEAGGQQGWQEQV